MAQENSENSSVEEMPENESTIKQYNNLRISYLGVEIAWVPELFFLPGAVMYMAPYNIEIESKTVEKWVPVTLTHGGVMIEEFNSSVTLKDFHGMVVNQQEVAAAKVKAAYEKMAAYAAANAQQEQSSDDASKGMFR